MSTFAVTTVRVTITSHPNADALELARVGDYCSVVRKGQFQSGDLVAYIPEQALVPEPILDELGLKGRLAGAGKNRVKAIKLRGVLSQGICLPAREGWLEGTNLATLLGITKYEPPVPTHMNGVLYPAGLDRCMKYDIENFKRFPEVIEPGEEVIFTEKIHGTWCQLGLVPEAMAHPKHGCLVVSSKGLAAKGLALMPDAEKNATTLYLRVARNLDITTRLRRVFGEQFAAGMPVFVLGEVFGKGVQDLSYGAVAASEDKIGFRVFDIYVGPAGSGHYLSHEALSQACQALELARVPVVYRGPFSREVMVEHTNGRESVSGSKLHLREGVVIRPVHERHDDLLGRVQLKSVSEAYLLRKGGTEYN